MAIHASLGWRNARKAGSLDRGVTVTAIDAESRHMVLMTERNRLRPAHSRIGHVRRALNLRRSPEQCRHYKDGAIDRGPRKSIRAAVKNLHRMDAIRTADAISKATGSCSVTLRGHKPQT